MECLLFEECVESFSCSFVISLDAEEFPPVEMEQLAEVEFICPFESLFFDSPIEF